MLTCQGPALYMGLHATTEPTVAGGGGGLVGDNVQGKTCAGRFVV